MYEELRIKNRRKQFIRVKYNNKIGKEINNNCKNIVLYLLSGGNFLERKVQLEGLAREAKEKLRRTQERPLT